ncbi:hypothetical protein IWQ60_004768, partial [Tieghemiomyces parasiticus]
METLVNLATDFVLRTLLAHRQHAAALPSAPPVRPLMVAFNGPQGSGKTTVCRQLCARLGAAPYRVPTVTVSLDDFYLTYDEQERRYHTSGYTSLDGEASGRPGSLNPLLRYRGEPGTHDLALGTQTLTALRGINKGGGQTVRVPCYDKALRGGRGDRCPPEQWPTVTPPVQVVLFEGWMVGFRALSDAELDNVYHRPTVGALLRHYTLGQLREINQHLRNLEAAWYPLLDCFVGINTPDIGVVYQWRLQQEHALARSRPGRTVLSDAEIRDFVDRYMPAYTLYLPRLAREGLMTSTEAAGLPCPLNL